MHVTADRLNNYINDGTDVSWFVEEGECGVHCTINETPITAQPTIRPVIAEQCPEGFQYASDTCISENAVFVEPNPSCDASDSCDGSYDNPFPTIQDASDDIGYDYTKVITLKPGTYTGAGNTNLHFQSIDKRFSSTVG